MQQMNSEPSDAQLMKAGLDILANASSSRDEMHHALTALRYLVEPIDNAKGLFLPFTDFLTIFFPTIL